MNDTTYSRSIGFIFSCYFLHREPSLTIGVKDGLRLPVGESAIRRFSPNCHRTEKFHLGRARGFQSYAKSMLNIFREGNILKVAERVIGLVSVFVIHGHISSPRAYKRSHDESMNSKPATGTLITKTYHHVACAISLRTHKLVSAMTKDIALFRHRVIREVGYPSDHGMRLA